MLFHVITILAATLVAVLAVPTPDPGGASNGMVIPLTKHSLSLNVKKTVDTDMIRSHDASHDANIFHRMRSERNTAMSHPSTVGRDGSPHSGAGVDLTNAVINYGHQFWYGIISIGTPARSFTVQFDTGSSDLFVPTSTGDENCRSHPNLWDLSSSQIVEASDPYFELRFADGAIVIGEQYTDNVTIAGFTADIQTIGAATTCSLDMAAPTFPSDGILGLAFPSGSAYPASPLLHTLFNEGKLPQPVFSLMLTASGGELYIGGMNKALYIDSSLAFTHVTNPFYWELRIDSIQVNGNTVLTDVPAIIDTGSHFIIGDSSRVLTLYQAYGGKAFKNGFYTFPCSAFPSVTLTIGEKPYLIPAHVLEQGRVNPGSRDCFGAIGTYPEDLESWTIGTIFLQRFYTVFDFDSESPRVGFAKLARMPIT